MIQAGEKTFELQFRDDGPACVVRPQFPFLAEGFRIVGAGELEIHGEGRRLRFALSREEASQMVREEELTLYEFPAVGSIPMREIILVRGEDR